MTDSQLVPIKEVLLKTDNDSGRFVILRPEKGADAALSMVVGEPEFLALAKEKKMIQTPRPLTHELYLQLLAETEIEFLRIEIYGLRDQTYQARIVYQLKEIEKDVEARPSDALALALNRGLPILVNPNLLKKGLTPGQLEAYRDLIKSVKF
ncbi:MAG TPA: bifunctional nuclease family protein [Thermodesulfobacteriota bacterium]|nr:bifunctional nuclease family protein [Thermodesulfobacteriota bacterium]